MQHAGTLRKRRRRNLAKVNGLANVPYHEDSETMDGQHRSCFKTRENLSDLSHYSLEFADSQRKSVGGYSSRMRVTRNPIYHEYLHDSDDQFKVSLKKNWDNYDIIDVEKNLNLTTRNNRTSSRIRSTKNPTFRQKLRKVFDVEIGFSQSDEQKDDIESEQSLPFEEMDRPYFFDNQTMSRLKQILFLGKTSGAFPWKWDNMKCNILKYSPIFVFFWKLFRIIFLAQTCCITIFQLYTLYELASSGKFTNREIFMTSFTLLWYVVWLDFAANIFFYGEQIREYINTLLKFNHDMVNKYVIYLDGHKEGGRLLMNFSILGDLTAVLMSLVFFLRMPNLPWYLFSYIAPKPWYWLVPGGVQQFWLAGQAITSHTLVYWLLTAHTSTMQFWLTEIHSHNDSDYTSEQLRRRETSFEVFKSLQVLNNHFNDCMSPLFIPIVKLHTAGVAVLCGYVTIRSMNELFIEEFPQSLYFPMSTMNCAVDAFVMLTLSSQVFDLSCGFIESWSLTKNRDFRKQLLSCPTLKIQVRKFYFITVSTTIAFFKVLSDLITDAIISFI